MFLLVRIGADLNLPPFGVTREAIPHDSQVKLYQGAKFISLTITTQAVAPAPDGDSTPKSGPVTGKRIKG